ncbi:uncharacterized protein PG998_011559 [Apiospora kogelbergensis]|uniref:uncharacterized protein n=1 Tax=Apiospora kogelbergensis TaxID=1337665 RepID=UPI00313048D2
MVDQQSETGSTDSGHGYKRWYMIYRILFPNDPPDKDPSPYHDMSIHRASVAGDSVGSLGVDLPHDLQGQIVSLTQTLAKDIAKIYVSARDSGNLRGLEPQTSQRSNEFTKDVLNMLKHDKKSEDWNSSECMDPESWNPSVSMDSMDSMGLLGILGPVTPNGTSPDLTFDTGFEVLPANYQLSRMGWTNRYTFQDELVNSSFPACPIEYGNPVLDNCYLGDGGSSWLDDGT